MVLDFSSTSTLKLKVTWISEILLGSAAIIFVTSAKNSISEQVENTFNYNFKEGRNVNDGIYIMYYDTDYTIKQAQ